MRNILFIIQNLGGGGAERVLINILNNLDYNKYQVDLLLIHNSGVYLDRVNRNVKKTYILSPLRNNINILSRISNSFRYRLYTRYPKVCASFFIKRKYDVEIAFLEGASTRLLSMSPNKDSKKIAWIHTDLAKHRMLSIPEEREVYSKIDEVICVSNESLHKFINLYPEYKNKSKVIYNLLDKEEILRKSNETLDNPVKENTILAVGRLSQSKRFDILIKAHKLLLDEGVDNRLIILGEGELRAYLTSLIKKLTVENSVFLPGFVENPYPYIKNCTIFAMSSEYEGLPLAVAEAMILGKAIVSTDCTGVAELLEQGKNGMLVEKNDEIKLKDALKELLLDKKARRDFEIKALESNGINKSKILKELDMILSS